MTKTSLHPTGQSSAKFEELTETSDVPLSPEAASMMYTRYLFGMKFATDLRVLEIGCGPGHGFGLLGSVASQVIGGDVSMELLRRGHRHYGTRHSFVQFSAQDLPFPDNSFDLVLFFEASYYVPNTTLAFDEIARVLSPGGIALFVNANPERPDFVRSPHSVHYHTAGEFRTELERRGFRVHIEFAFPVRASGASIADRVIGAVTPSLRKVMRRAGIVPKTLRGRARLKRLVHRNLVRIQPELKLEFAKEEPRVDAGQESAGLFKVLYVAARK